MPAVQTNSLQTELQELEVEARAWFDFAPANDETLAALERLARKFVTSSQLDISRPDRLNLELVRNLSDLPSEWDDAHVFAGVALAALQVAADGIEDEAYALRYLGAGRDALRLAELVVAPRSHANAQTEAAADARREMGSGKLDSFVALWRDLPKMKIEAKVQTIADRLSLSPKRIEALRTEARKLGMID